MKTHRLLLGLLLLVVIDRVAMAQRPSSYSQIEVWGLVGESNEQFIAKLVRQNGIGAEAACMAVLKVSLGYKNPGVYIFPNPNDPDSSTMLITLRQVPPSRYTTTMAPRPAIQLPDEWGHLRRLATDTVGGARSRELQSALRSFEIFAAGDTARVSSYLSRMKDYVSKMGGSYDVEKVKTILDAIAQLRASDVALALDIYLHSSDLNDRRLASYVLLNHLRDKRVIDAFVRTLWDNQLVVETQEMLSTYLQNRCRDSSRAAGPVLDATALGEILNHPDPVVCDLGLQVLQCGKLDSAYLREAFAGGALTLKEYLRSDLKYRNFRSAAIEALRKCSSADYGEDIGAWIVWIETGFLSR
jgi:hypothetical protein